MLTTGAAELLALVVDDDGDCRALLCEAHAVARVAAVGCASGDEALAHAERRVPAG